MKAHELARKLLEGPDLEVTFTNECADEGLHLVSIDEVEPLTRIDAMSQRFGWQASWGSVVLELR